MVFHRVDNVAGTGRDRLAPRPSAADLCVAESCEIGPRSSSASATRTPDRYSGPRSLAGEPHAASSFQWEVPVARPRKLIKAGVSK
jgi:hypothetical protein